jgi:Tfp pilus assembly protein PilN
MIEINLLPGSAGKRSKRRLPQFTLKRGTSKPRDGGKPSDPWMLFAVIAWILGPALVGWLFFTTSTTRSDLEIAIEGARLDSTRYAEMRAANAVLIARQDTIAQKLDIIQEIDAGRYVWAHIVDEVSRAVPQYTWLMNLHHVSTGSPMGAPSFLIDGRTGNTFALTQFMQELEASPFIKNVTLILTDQIRQNDKLLYSFALQGDYQEPTPDLIRTVPLFSREAQ